MTQDKTNNLLRNREFLIVSGINFFVMFIYYMLFVISGPFATDQFQASPSISGITAGAMVLGCLLGRFFTGRFIEIIGCKKILIWGTIGYAISITFYFFIFNISSLVTVRFISGIGVGITGTATGTLIALIVPRHQIGLGISYFSLSTILAMAIGPFLGIQLMSYTSYSTVFLISFLMSFFCILLFFLMNFTKDMADPITPTEQTAVPGLHHYIDLAVLPIALVAMVVATGYAAVQAFILPYAREIGQVDAASFFFLVYAIVILFSRPITGRILDIYGSNVVVYPALIILSAGFVLLYFSHSSWMILLAGAFIGLGFGNFQSTSQAIAVSIVPRERLPQANSTFFIFFDLGVGLAPYLLGFIISGFGYHNLYLCIAVLSLLCTVLYHFAHGHQVKTTRKPQQ